MFKNKLSLILMFTILPLSLIKAAARIESEEFKEELPICLNDQFINAVKKGDLHLIKDLLAKGAEINAKDQKGMTALHWACFKGYLEIVKYLVFMGIDINYNNEKCAPALSIAILKEDKLIVEYLLSRGANLSWAVPGNAFGLAYSTGNKQIIYLLSQTAKQTTKIDLSNFLGINEFVLLCNENCDLEIVEDFLTKIGFTSELQIKDFINKDSDIPFPGTDGRIKMTAVLMAIVSRRNDVLNFLLSKGANNTETLGLNPINFLLALKDGADHHAADFMNRLTPILTEDEILDFLFKKSRNFANFNLDIKKPIKLFLEYGCPLPAPGGQLGRNLLPGLMLKINILDGHIHLMKFLGKLKGREIARKYLRNLLGKLPDSAWIKNTIEKDNLINSLYEPLTSDDLNTLDGFDMTPMMFAAARGDAKSILALYEYCKSQNIEIDFSVTNNDGETALALAKKHKKSEAIDSLMKCLKPYIDKFSESTIENKIPYPVALVILSYCLG